MRRLADQSQGWSTPVRGVVVVEVHHVTGLKKYSISSVICSFNAFQHLPGVCSAREPRGARVSPHLSGRANEGRVGQTVSAKRSGRFR